MSGNAKNSGDELMVNARIIGVGDSRMEVVSQMAAAGMDYIGLAGVDADVLAKGEAEFLTAVKDTDMLFVVGDIGDDGAAEAAKSVARMAKRSGILTAVLMTEPPAGGYTERKKGLREFADAIMVFPYEDKPDIAHDAIRKVIGNIYDAMNLPMLMSLDFSDIRTIIADGGNAAFGMGKCKGEDKGRRAAETALADPLTEAGFGNMTDFLVSISGDVTLADANDAVTYVQESAGDDADIFFCVNIDGEKKDEASVAVIATEKGRADGYTDEI